MVPEIATCQRMYGTKVLLALGGGTDGYQLTGAADGTTLANQLWGMFGPRNSAWVAAKLPRPFDSDTTGTAVDGFTLDIEHPSTGRPAPGLGDYIIGALTGHTKTAQLAT